MIISFYFYVRIKKIKIFCFSINNNNYNFFTLFNKINCSRKNITINFYCNSHHDFFPLKEIIEKLNKKKINFNMFFDTNYSIYKYIYEYAAGKIFFES